MIELNYSRPCHVHFIGIGGVSMSGLAEILMDEGFGVSGSDLKESDLTRHLASMGARIAYGPQRAENIPEGTDAVVFTAAVHPDNPEWIGAKERGIPMLTRAELLGQVMSHYQNAINVAGTHGKTTTTALISEIFLEAGKDPTVTVGGILPSIGGNVRVGSPENIVVEACEYTNSFLSFHPTAEVVLNIEADHLDFFKDIEDIRHSFRRFMELLPENGLLVINSDIRDWAGLTQGLPCRVLTVGSSPESDYHPEEITYDRFAHPVFRVVAKDGTDLGEVSLRVPGEHNVYNALAAIALSLDFGIPMEDIRVGIAHFTGTKRRFEWKGEFGGVTLVDDYAHHPQEITATLKAARNCPKKKLWCIFQPHTYTRTKALLDDFAKALALADEVVLTKIYPARETDTLGISSDDVRERIERLGTPASYYETFEEVEEAVRRDAGPGDLVITMGAGDVWQIGEALLGRG